MGGEGFLPVIVAPLLQQLDYVGANGHGGPLCVSVLRVSRFGRSDRFLLGCGSCHGVDGLV